MESFESKLDRLSPEKRKEVEEFVDFLLYRSENSHDAPGTTPASLEFMKVAPPPLILQEPVHVPENPSPKEYDLHQAESSSLSVKIEEQVTPIKEIIIGNEDRISRDYMDYGQFEKNPSPATVAVKKVKEKLQHKEEQEKPRVSLDWID